MWVGLNPVQQLDEYRHIIGDSKPSILFGFNQLRNRDNREILKSLKTQFSCVRHLVRFDDVSGDRSEYESFIASGRTVSPDDVAVRAACVKPDDPALIVYTSGSTGSPKGAILSQGNIAHAAQVYCLLWPLDPLRILCNLPITHVACCVETVAYALAGRGTIVFQEHFDARAFLSTIEREAISWIPLVPTMFQRILALPDWTRYDTSSLKVILFGGAAMPADMIEKLKQLGETVVGCWGMTETTSGVTFTDKTDSLEILSQSVGRAAPTFEIAIMGDRRQLLAAGETGEVVVRGPCVFQGYFGRPDATNEVMDHEGWLHSGDLGRVDEKGRFYIVGRIKEMFKSGGYNVYPREIENVLEAHPAVSMAVVVSVPDPVYQEVGYAFVAREPGMSLTGESIVRHCRERLANYKIPKRVFVRDSLPMLSTGKIDRTALRNEAAAAAEQPAR
jgi:acyl-CoA synthetase (AMP-forming)/AMP-acid ligase II